MKPFLKLALLTSLLVGAQAASAAAAEVATSTHADRMKIVPSLGYSYFNISGSSTDYQSKSGSSAGVLVQMPLDEKFEFESGLEYIETGAKTSYNLGGILSIETGRLEVQQLAIPIRGKFNFNPASNGTRYFAKAGLTPTYLLSAKGQDLSGNSTDKKSDLKDYGLLSQAGIGADWGLDAITGRITFDFTYSYGLTKVFKDQDGRSTGFNMNLGYAFML